MVCPNCKSNDIVELQGQHFCINCGKLIELMTKKRGPGRPKAQRLDRPKVLTLQQAAVGAESSIDAAAAIDDTIHSSTLSEVASTDSSGEVQPVITPTAQTDSNSTSNIIHGFNPPKRTTPNGAVVPNSGTGNAKRLQDIRPSSGTNQRPDEKSIVEPSSAIPQPDPLRLSPIVAAAWSEPWQSGPIRLLSIAAVLTALATGLIVYRYLAFPDRPYTYLDYSGLISIALAIALLFGIANTERTTTALRRYDHRPVPRSWLLGGAIAVLGWQSLTLLLGLLDVMLVGLAGWAANYYLPQLLPQPYLAVALLASFFVMSLLLLAIWAKTGLASAAVELGQMRPYQAALFGWKSLWHHPDLLGTRLIAALWLAASLSGVIALGWTLHLYASDYDRFIITGSAVSLALTAVYLGNLGAVGWRQAAYRELVIIDEPDRAIALLSGHHTGSPARIVSFSLTLFGTLLAGAGLAAVFASFYR